MARVAVVTGGTRGIGAAISKALKAAGYKVAATYAGNDEAAQKFKTETGISVYKWDVSSFDACGAGIKQIEADLGPVEVLINNAGITRDTPFHRMTPEHWSAVINTNLGSLFNMTRHVFEGMRALIVQRLALAAQSVIELRGAGAGGFPFAFESGLGFFDAEFFGAQAFGLAGDFGAAFVELRALEFQGDVLFAELRGASLGLGGFG